MQPPCCQYRRPDGAGLPGEVYEDEIMVRVLMLGARRVGKTTLGNRLMTGMYEDIEPMTPGVTFDEYQYKFYHKLPEDTRPAEIWLTVIDTPCASTWMHEMDTYIDSTDACLIVTSVENKASVNLGRKVYQGMMELRDPPLVAVAHNKCESKSRQVMEEEIAALKSDSMPCNHYETSCITGQNIETAFVDLVSQVRLQRKSEGKKSSCIKNYTGCEIM